MGFAWVVVAASRTTVALWSLPTLVGAVGLALVLEVKCRDLEKMTADRSPS
jgi:hypothetical protein